MYIKTYQFFLTSRIVLAYCIVGEDVGDLAAVGGGESLSIDYPVFEALSAFSRRIEEVYEVIL